MTYDRAAGRRGPVDRSVRDGNGQVPRLPRGKVGSGRTVTSSPRVVAREGRDRTIGEPRHVRPNAHVPVVDPAPNGTAASANSILGAARLIAAAVTTTPWTSSIAYSGARHIPGARAARAAAVSSPSPAHTDIEHRCASRRRYPSPRRWLLRTRDASPTRARRPPDRSVTSPRADRSMCRAPSSSRPKFVVRRGIHHHLHMERHAPLLAPRAKGVSGDRARAASF